MPGFKRLSISGQQLFEEIVRPAFGDMVTEQAYRSGLFGEFMVLNDVADSRKIVDITPIKNILKRRDASCKLTYDPVGKANLRRVSVTDVYAATAFCQNEFYQGCLKDWRNGDPSFVTRIFDFFRKAVRTDLMSNTYFGDVSRVATANDAWSHNIYDGIYTQYKKYVADGTIPGAQTFNIPNAAITPANSVTYLQNLLDKQDELLELMDDSEKAIYIDKDWSDAYRDYLIGTATYNTNATSFIVNGVTMMAYKGIPIFVNKFAKPILNQIVAANAHFGYLTLRGNFVFATDDSYGEGPSGNQALVVWYDYDEMTWKYQLFLKAGTQIALPEHSVLALPS